MTEHEIQQAILLALGGRRDLRIWRNNSGVAFGKGRAVRFGVVGQADLSGILKGGRRLEIEVKRRGERPTEEQVSFGAMIQRYGGVWAVVRSVEEAIAVVEASLAGEEPCKTST